MKSVLSILVPGLLCLAGPATAFAQQNIALDKPVTLNGTFFQFANPADIWNIPGTYAPPLSPNPSPQTVVDGAFLPTGNQWDIGPIWWDAHSPNADGQSIDINLQGTFLIDSFVVQADNNDKYSVQYWDRGSASWLTAWEVQWVDGWGMYTRPDANDNTMRYSLPSPIVTDELRVVAVDGDGYYSISEIQAFGQSVPEALPTAGALSLVLLGLSWMRRYIKTA